MPNEAPPAPLTEADYGSIEDAVMETARGRWFLAEFARRMRAADTDRLLAAIARLEHALHWRQGPSPGEAAEVAALRSGMRRVAENLQDIVWRLRERDFADDVCRAVEHQAAALADLAGGGSAGVRDVHALELAAERGGRPAEPRAIPRAAPADVRPVLPEPPAPRDARLAALARIDALPPAEKLALFV